MLHVNFSPLSCRIWFAFDCYLPEEGAKKHTVEQFSLTSNKSSNFFRACKYFHETGKMGKKQQRMKIHFCKNIPHVTV